MGSHVKNDHHTVGAPSLRMFTCVFPRPGKVNYAISLKNYKKKRQLTLNSPRFL
jgi:hypothetical protein